MPESNIVTCYLCGAEGNSLEMHAAGSPVLGHHLDFVMGVTFFCPTPCFEEFRRNSHLRARVHKKQDAAAEDARACVRECLESDLAAMASLPDGLKVTPSDRARLAQLKDKLEDVTQLQDDADNHLLHRVCRNIKKHPFHHPKTGMRKDYDSLVEDFKKLEKLTPAQRKALEG